MNGYSIYLMISLAQSMGVMSKELEYDLAWKEGQVLFTEYMGTPFAFKKISKYDSFSGLSCEVTRKYGLFTTSEWEKLLK